MRRMIGWVGLGLILCGLAVLGFVAWEYEGTNVVSHHTRDQVLDEWKVQPGLKVVPTSHGSVAATIQIPRLGATWREPVLEGTGDEQLAAGVGHWTGSAGPGEVGNYVLFAHRVTHGEPFRDFPDLRAGDRVVVTTRHQTFTYRLVGRGLQERVSDQALWVTRPRPIQGLPARARLITLGTCAELFHTDGRLVAFGVLTSTH